MSGLLNDNSLNPLRFSLSGVHFSNPNGVRGYVSRGDGGSEARLKKAADLLQLSDLLFDRMEGHKTFGELEQSDPKVAMALFIAIVGALKLGADLPQDEWGNQERRICVDLCGTGTCGLIILAPTKVFYSNQVGGLSNNHPSVEGFFVPLGYRDENLSKLMEFFAGGKWCGWCESGIDEETAQFVDDFFGTHLFHVDRAALSSSCEAWIQVVVHNESPSDLSLLYPEFKGHAVLTWRNSD